MPHNGEAEIFTGYCLPYVDDDGAVDHRDQLTSCHTVDVLLEMLFEFTNPGIRVSALLIEVNTLPATLVCAPTTVPLRDRHESHMRPTVLETVGDLPLKQCADELLQIEKLPTHNLAQLGAVGDAHTPLVISADE